jgi:hypothetical protein
MNLRSSRHAMKKENEIVRIEFTPEQKELIEKATGKHVDAVELTARELEERIAPVVRW